MLRSVQQLEKFLVLLIWDVIYSLIVLNIQTDELFKFVHILVEKFSSSHLVTH